MSRSNQKNHTIGSVSKVQPSQETPDEAFKRLAQLAVEDYELIRTSEAKKLGPKYRVSTLDKGVQAARKAAGISDPLSDESKDDFDIIEMVKAEGTILFHDEGGEPYAEIKVDNHIEIWAIKSTRFAGWLDSLYWKTTESILTSYLQKDTINTLAGLAIHDGAEQSVYLRVAYVDNKNYIDLCDKSWRVVEVDELGWRVLDVSPVKFKRTSTMEALPLPKPGGDYTKLWAFLNIESYDQKFILTLIIDSLRANTQYVVCEITGEQGSAKSSTQTKIKRLYDPNELDLRIMTTKVDDIWIGTQSTHCLSFENVSDLSQRVQDALCVIATGGGSIKRKLYSDSDEIIINACNPILINGIVPIITASDLSDRAIRIKLPKLDSDSRIENTKINADFEAAQQSIFSGILDVFSGALSEIDNISLTEKPRMMSYAILGEAINKHLGLDWTFTKDYILMRQNLLIQAAQNSSGAMAIVKMAKAIKQPFNGTYKGLLHQLNLNYSPSFKSDDWPKTPRALSAVIARFTPGLEALGIEITVGGHTSKGNMLSIKPL